MISLREERPGDLSSLERLFTAAFPDEDLLGLVQALGQSPEALSLVAEESESLVGHVAFTGCSIGASPAQATLLGPLAVAPDRQRQGIGSALVQEGLRLGRDAGRDIALVLGDPRYYGRFGFTETGSIAPPYPIPEAWAPAWQSLSLSGATPVGRLSVPEPWQNPSFWSS